MALLTIQSSDRAIAQYYATRQELAGQGVIAEGSVRRAFGSLLAETAKQRNWTLIEEHTEKSKRGKYIRPDGVLRDVNQIPYGYWEAKDTRDDLEREIHAKLASGYDRFLNIIFEDTTRAVLFQDKQRVTEANLNDPEDVALLLTRFYRYANPNYDNFAQAQEEFFERIKLLGERLARIIATAHEDNPTFQKSFADFFAICQEALNPNISRKAVDEMLIQHLLTERLMRNVLDNPEFTRRNIIAREVENVIDALTSKSFSRHEFFSDVEPFYQAIEATARHLPDFEERHTFLDRIYERFFQGYSVKVADTHGIVYTPHEIVDFMCAAVEEVLHDEFGLSLTDPDVNILDPATGTGRFILNLMRRIAQTNRRDLKRVYTQQLFANEVMLLPYYVAALNIEHEYRDLMGEYEPFPGLVFADTLDMVKHQQLGMFTPANTERMERERQAPITVIIGNPPYNVGQINENDNNKNRRYNVIDERVRATYSADSNATNVNALSDVYVKFFRWAVDRLGERDGVIAFVTNNYFIDGIAFDGMRKHLFQDFDHIYHVDLKGNARTSGERRRREGGNVFMDQIRVGVGITVLVRHKNLTEKKLFYAVVGDYWKAEEKLAWLARHVELDGRQNSLNTVQWRELTPNDKHTWLVSEYDAEFSAFMSTGDKDSKGESKTKTIFRTYSGGLKTNRDAYVYDFDAAKLRPRIRTFIEAFNAEVDRYKRTGFPENIDGFVKYNMGIGWSRDLKLDLKRGNYAVYDESKIRRALYRPFTRHYVFFDRILNEEVYVFPGIFPTPESEQENQVIIVGGYGRKDFATNITNLIPDLNFYADPQQSFPFYVYNEDGSNRRENITDWALAQFRAEYDDESISKWDIFYYVYGLLHHPGYRERYADNLKRELPRLPFAPDFRAFSAAGQKLADLHLNYESAPEYPLEWVENPDVRMNWRVEKMRFNRDKSELQVNDWLTFKGIPPQAHEYRLGNRSALDWIVDQYQVKTDSRSQIESDPNDPHNERYIAELVARVTYVSVETVKIVGSLPEEFRR